MACSALRTLISGVVFLFLTAAMTAERCPGVSLSIGGGIGFVIETDSGEIGPQLGKPMQCVFVT